MKKLLLIFVSLFFLFLLPAPISANHSWEDYHWARTSNPFTLNLGNNTSGTWTNHLLTASDDWSQSTVLNTAVVAGGTRPKTCRATMGRDEVCNASYGNNGWLGLAQIWIDSSHHILQGVVKANDSYFSPRSTYSYKNEAEKLHVMCQEIGHTLGLDHQSTDGSSQNTCMDYYHNLSDSDTQSTHPNTHDYEELVTIYTHLDGYTTSSLTSTSRNLPAAAFGDLNSPSEWGMQVRSDARESLFVRELGGGNRLFTFVTWAR